MRQLEASDRRSRGLRWVGAPLPVTSPAVATATSPEAPSASVGRNARKGTAKETAVESTGFASHPRSRSPPFPMATPNTTATATA